MSSADRPPSGVGVSEPDPTAEDADPPRSTGWTRLPFTAAGALAVVLLVTLVVKAATWDWLAVGDYGSIRLRSLDVGTSATPLVGVYSRWGWNHPGPMFLYVLAPFVRLVGGAGKGLLLGALFANVASIGLVLWVAARAGRRTLALVSLVLTLLVVGLDPAWLMNAWNPYLLIVPLFAASIAAWRAALGDRVAAVVLMVTGSFALQAHVLAGPAVGLLVLMAVGGLAIRAWRGPERSHDLRTMLLAAAVGLVCWIPPLIDQANGTGNLRQLFSFLLNGQEKPVGFAFGARVMGRALSVPPLWVTGGTSTERHPIPWILIGLVAATAWAWHRRWTSELVLCATAWLLTIAGFVGSSRVTGVAYPYLFEWLRVSAAVVWLAVAAVLVAELAHRFAWADAIPAALVAVAAVVLLAQLVAGPDLTNLERSDRPLRDVYPVVDQTLDELQGARGPILITPTDYIGIQSSIGIELLWRAADEGIDVRYPPDLAHVVGTHRTIDPDQAAGEVVIASGAARAAYDADPRYRKVAGNDPLAPDEWAELDQLNARTWGPDGSPTSGPDWDRFQQLSDLAFEDVAVYVSFDR